MPAKKMVKPSGATRKGKLPKKAVTAMKKSDRINAALDMARQGSTWYQIKEALNYPSMAQAKREVESAIVDSFNPEYAFRVQTLSVERLEDIVCSIIQEYKLWHSKGMAMLESALESNNAREIKKATAMLEVAKEKREQVVYTLQSQCNIAGVKEFLKALTGGSKSARPDTMNNVVNNFLYKYTEPMHEKESEIFLQVTDEEVEHPEDVRNFIEQRKKQIEEEKEKSG